MLGALSVVSLSNMMTNTMPTDIKEYEERKEILEKLNEYFQNEPVIKNDGRFASTCKLFKLTKKKLKNLKARQYKTRVKLNKLRKAIKSEWQIIKAFKRLNLMCFEEPAVTGT